MIKILKAHRHLGFYMLLLTFVWKCFQDRNFHGVVVGLYEQSKESGVGLIGTVTYVLWTNVKGRHPVYRPKLDKCLCTNLDNRQVSLLGSRKFRIAINFTTASASSCKNNYSNR